jgi:hypothetical protein
VGNRTWRDLGSGPLTPPGHITVDADLTSAGSTAWIAWTEVAAGETPETHVARLTRWGVRELPGSPITGADAPQISYFGGRLYVAPARPGEMGVYRGRLYLSDGESGPSSTRS